MPKNSSPWNLHVKKTMNENKGKSLGEVLKMASRTYKKGPSVVPAMSKRPVRTKRPAMSKRPRTKRPARTMRPAMAGGTKKRKKRKSKKRKSKKPFSPWF
jgi:hypothetical protein